VKTTWKSVSSSVAHEVAARGEHLRNPIDRVHEHPAEHERPELVRAEREARDHAEVPAASANAPEEVLVLPQTRRPDRTVRGDDLDLDETVATSSARARWSRASARSGPELADLNARLDVAEAMAETLPHRRKYLLLNHRLARRIVRAYGEWLDEVERELEPTKPRSRGGSAPPTA